MSLQSGQQQNRERRGPGGQSVDLERLINQRVRVKFAGGREMVGKLCGYDQLVNLVLDDVVEYLRDPKDASRLSDETRSLGLVVCRGPNITVLAPEDGLIEVENPFGAEETS
jgi:U6 snRNA-associated Sm-like protein LSm7